MTKYLIQQYLDNNIIVYKNGIEYLKVNREISFFGRVTSSVYQYGEQILKVQDQRKFFKRIMLIEFQALPQYLTLECMNGDPILNLGGKSLLVKKRLFKRPPFLFFINDFEAGQVNAELITMNLNPLKFEAVFKNERDENFYLLILFLLTLERQNE